MAKIFIKLIYKMLYTLINTKNIISKNHYGSIKNISFQDALIRLTYILDKNIDMSVPTLDIRDL